MTYFQGLFMPTLTLLVGSHGNGRRARKMRRPATLGDHQLAWPFPWMSLLVVEPGSRLQFANPELAPT